jgi:hypothetical protein
MSIYSIYNRKDWLIVSVLTIVAVVAECQAFVPSYFYRPAPFWGEPRFERNYLSTGELLLFGGSTNVSRNKCNRKVPLLSILPKHKYHGGALDFFEADLIYSQNFCYGLFLEGSLIFNTLRLYSCNTHDCSIYRTVVKDGSCRCLCNEPKKFLCHKPFKCTGLADAVLLVGWTCNYEKTCLLDFIDVTVRVGAVIPSDKRVAHEKRNLVIPTGYNGRYGAVAALTSSIGLYDWLTVGFNVDAVWLEHCKKSSKCAREAVKRGGIYFKADHVYKGLSLWLAVGHESKNKGCCGEPFGFCWSRSLIYLNAEYDFSRPDWSLGPRVGFYYVRNLRGKNVFETNLVGGSLTCDIAWSF